jgi:hypothetical protein
MWDKTLDDYAMMYITVARRLKAEFPDIKIGGPATTTLNATIMKNFLTKCKAADAPVDFISWHRYTKRPEDLADQAKLAYLLAADCGYPEAELHLNEWHYMPEDFNTLRLDSKARERLLTSPEGMHGIDSAAFNVAALTLWQDTPLAMSNFYNSTGSWGLFDRFYNPMRVYDSFLAFAPFADHLQRVWTQSCSSGCTILAGTDESGTNGMILISAFRMKSNSISLQIKGISPDTELLVEAAEADHGLAEHPYNFADGTLTLGKSSKSAIFRIMLKNIK